MYFANCIIEGSQGNEFEQDLQPIAGHVCKITNSLIRGSIPTTTLITNTSNVFNADPKFDNPAGYSFKLNSGSAAKNIADYNVVSTYISILNFDITGTTARPGTGATSSGAYQ
jgi:hypothetical protein